MLLFALKTFKRDWNLGTDATLLDFPPVQTAPPVLPTTQDGYVFRSAAPPGRTTDQPPDGRRPRSLLLSQEIRRLHGWMAGHSAMWNGNTKTQSIDPSRSRSNGRQKPHQLRDRLGLDRFRRWTERRTVAPVCGSGSRFCKRHCGTQQ